MLGAPHQGDVPSDWLGFLLVDPAWLVQQAGRARTQAG
jgi:hypothetical protein